MKHFFKSFLRFGLLAVLLSSCFLSQAIAHEHDAPHGGTLVELGKEFAHVELVLNTQEGLLIAYILDGEAEKSVRIDQLTIEMKIVGAEAKNLSFSAHENVLTGETAGDTSEFRIQDPFFKKLTKFDAVFTNLKVRGTSFKDVSFNFPDGNEENGKVSNE
jgi:hypothetical protein